MDGCDSSRSRASITPRTTVVHQRAVLGRDSTSRIGEVGLGNRLGRLDLGVSLVGDGSSSEVVGLYFGEGDQTLDYRMVIDHQGRSTTSDVFLKGAVEDDAQSVFTGLLRIEKDAAERRPSRPIAISCSRRMPRHTRCPTSRSSATT